MSLPVDLVKVVDQHTVGTLGSLSSSNVFLFAVHRLRGHVKAHKNVNIYETEVQSITG